MDASTENIDKLDILDGDHDKFAHYANYAHVTRAYVEGGYITALCGKTWIPSDDPEKFPICPTCRDIYKVLFLRDQRDSCGND